MSADGDAPVPNEIVIVKRRAGFEEEGHHGGAWKIAFADLMTAMMTFFLVMWLLNISEKEKIVKIATYFNPQKLTDKVASPKGVHDVKEDTQSKGADGKVKVEETEDPKEDHTEKAVKPQGDGEEEKGDPKKAEEELFNDPYGVLARMALKAMNAGEKANGGTRDGEEMLPGGDAYRNPFEPYATDRPQSLHGRPTEEAKAGESETAVEGESQAAAPGGAIAVSPSAPEPKSASATEAEAKEAQPEVKELEKEIIQSLSLLGPERVPNIEVQKVDDGVLVSLTDDFRFGMFAVSSATPKPELVVVMEKIAKVLSTHEGRIVVRGHTDGRAFKSGKNDNWRLSMSRAQVAYYMLVRGGLQETRVERIEGHADRTLKVADDPNAAQNRRIEILLKVAKP